MAVNPFAGIPDEHLNVFKTLVAISCNRGHSPLSKSRREWFCALGRVIDLERGQRGLPALNPPWHVGDIPPGGQAL